MTRNQLSAIFIGSLLTAFSTMCAAESVTAGRDVYLTAGGYGCAVCHGPVANGAGQAGGPIRGASRQSLDNALVTQPGMQLLRNALSQRELADLSQYLVSLTEIPLVEMVFSDSSWAVKQSPVEKGKLVQIVVFNDSFDEVTADLEAFGYPSQPIAPMDTRVFEWVAQSGTYLLPGDALMVVSAEEVCEH